MEIESINLVGKPDNFKKAFSVVFKKSDSVFAYQQ